MRASVRWQPLVFPTPHITLPSIVSNETFRQPEFIVNRLSNVDRVPRELLTLWNNCSIPKFAGHLIAQGNINNHGSITCTRYVNTTLAVDLRMRGFSADIIAIANPFARRDTHPVQAIWTYKICTIISWLAVLVASFYYNFHAPQDDKKHWRNTIWGQNSVHGTPFAMNAFIASLYWYARPSLLQRGTVLIPSQVVSFHFANRICSIPLQWWTWARQRSSFSWKSFHR